MTKRTITVGLIATTALFTGCTRNLAKERLADQTYEMWISTQSLAEIGINARLHPEIAEQLGTTPIGPAVAESLIERHNNISRNLRELGTPEGE